MLLEKITNAVTYNMSRRVELDILYTDLAITCIWKKFGISLKNTKRWPLIGEGKSIMVFGPSLDEG